MMSTFQCVPDLGDVIYALPTIKALGGGKIYLTNGKGDHREEWTASRVEAIKPLLLAQPYIQGVEVHKGEKTTHSFTEFRVHCTAKTLLPESLRMAVSPMHVVKFSNPWIEVQADQHDRPVIARSARYHNPDWNAVWPSILRRHKKPLFIGLKEEHRDFCDKFGDVEFRYTSNLLEAAKIIAGASVFIGNQSCPLSIAHGLGRPVIVEVSPRVPNCIIQRPGAKYVRSLKDWDVTEKAVKIMIALQLCPRDQQAATELAQLIVDMEPMFNGNAEFAVCVTRDVPAQVSASIVGILNQKFKTHLIVSREWDTGWPLGCNALWRESVKQIRELINFRKTDCDCVATFEPDCCPMRKDWINALRDEWVKAKEEGKLLFGSLCNDPTPHINGNAVLDIRIPDKLPVLMRGAQAGWDVCHGSLLVKEGMESSLIAQRYKVKDISEEDLARIASEKAAILHGVKTDAARRFARKAFA